MLAMKNTEAGEKKGVMWLNFQLVENSFFETQ